MKKKTTLSPELTPETFTGLKTGEPKDVAVGMPAVVSSMKHVFGAMNVGRGMKSLLSLNQKEGFDCPSCAWPDPDDERSTIAEYCENGAKAVAEEATTKRLLPDFFAAHSIDELGTWSDYELSQQGRIAQPMYKPKGADRYKPIEWDDVFGIIAKHLNQLQSPNEAIFYTSGRTSNEAAFLYQLFVRQYGTNNLPDCSNMCHESSGVALTETVGIGKGSVKLDDLYLADLIIIAGQNPGTNHPRMLTALEKAKKNGAKILSINPLYETGLVAFSNPQTLGGLLGTKTTLSDVFLPVRINGDVPLFKAFLKLMYQAEQEKGGVFDWPFIEEQTTGIQELLADLERYTLPQLAEDCGLTAAQIEEAAALIIGSQKIVACWAMGLTQHKNAVDNIREVVNLLLVKGSIGKPGAGTCPVRGHSNVQGDRTMGIWEAPPQSLLDSLEKQFGFRPPQEHGYNTVEAIKAMHQGKATVFFAMGGNFLSATPDTSYTAKALRNCRLTAHVSTKLNRSHLVTGEEALILPCLGRTDIDIQQGEAQLVSVENSMGVVHQSKGKLTPVSAFLLSEPDIIRRLAKATFGSKSVVDWDNFLVHYDFIRNAIEKTIPGFENYNERVRRPGGFYLPNGAREGEFKTKSGKAAFSINGYSSFQLTENEYLMMTIRSHDQFNTTIYGLNDRYRGIYNERRVVLMNEKDILKRGWAPGVIVDLYNFFGGIERVAPQFIIVPYLIPEKCIATYFPEANTLVPIDSFADRSMTPTSKTVLVQMKSVL
ncbi:FdhF/YdeP family oxidoreductase [Runella slithyformis]|uniref:Oxidoreductase alpha (Molybdopterin) subunit n=1 Tax=Runella slithyformis (strain ATCC 29530 / DSM 19594 / LMG 11500 / NCIMB 11436 / LSU 4) TaxID=761193 RepID=A0A7U3ZN17_RUNSL|nr:FdhF/YdeP family oxidoreductase [Runella slithyformis]AEI50225.1 oxidoreductase alpha (molybdopterin) subunit [Runella slithyformis DSM 19594]